MTIAELIKDLQRYPMTSDVALWDADTDWKLPIHVGLGPYGQRRSLETGKLDETVYIYGLYDEVKT